MSLCPLPFNRFPTASRLRALATPLPNYRTLPFGLNALDERLTGGGLRAGALHEVAAKTCSLCDDAAAMLFLAGIAAREARHLGGPVLWASCRNDLYAPGLAQAGLRPADVIHAQPGDENVLLAVVEDDRRDEDWSPGPRNCYWPLHADGMDPEEVVRFKSHDFH